jgi:hypothetical protein
MVLGLESGGIMGALPASDGVETAPTSARARG